MTASLRPLTELTASDVMSRNVLALREEIPLREAVRLLLLHQVSGAPVIEPGGICVGVLSTTDVLHWVHKNGLPGPAGERVFSCLFQIKGRGPHGEERTLCTLPMGTCPIQRRGSGEEIVCSDPHSFLTDWQTVHVEELPAGSVGEFMTPDPVLVPSDAPVTEVAQKMVDAHIHRVIVVNNRQLPVGVISSTDLLACLARAGHTSVLEQETPI